EGVGALIYLPRQVRCADAIERLRALALQDPASTSRTAETDPGVNSPADLRDYGIGLQILKDLGLRRVRILTNHPKKTDDFVIQGHGLEIVDQVPIIAPDEAQRRRHPAAGLEEPANPLPDLSRNHSAADIIPGEG